MFLGLKTALLHIHENTGFSQIKLLWTHQPLCWHFQNSCNLRWSATLKLTAEDLVSRRLLSSSFDILSFKQYFCKPYYCDEFANDVILCFTYEYQCLLYYVWMCCDTCMTSPNPRTFPPYPWSGGCDRLVSEPLAIAN